MAVYRFPIDNIVGIMHHIPTYKGMVIESLTLDGTDYVLQVNIPIIADEVQHLSEGYGLVEVSQ